MVGLSAPYGVRKISLLRSAGCVLTSIVDTLVGGKDLCGHFWMKMALTVCSLPIQFATFVESSDHLAVHNALEVIASNDLFTTVCANPRLHALPNGAVILGCTLLRFA